MRNACFFVWLLLGSFPLAAASRIADIPGNGVPPCGYSGGVACPSGVGSVTVSSGILTGTLQQGGSNLGIQLGQQDAFLTFTTNPSVPSSSSNIVGPLGFNPQFSTDSASIGLQPVALAGQQIRISATNTAPITLNSVTFFLGVNQNSLSTLTNPVDDGLTFGVSCTLPAGTQLAGTGVPFECPQSNWGLELIPYATSGNLDAQDSNPSSPIFGDVVRFNNVNLAPGDTDQFTFYVTDYKSTRVPPGGSFTPASPTIVVEVAPNLAEVPEPASVLLLAAGLLATLGLSWRCKRLG